MGERACVCRKRMFHIIKKKKREKSHKKIQKT